MKLENLTKEDLKNKLGLTEEQINNNLELGLTLKEIYINVKKYQKIKEII